MAELKSSPHPLPLSHCDGRGELARGRSSTPALGGSRGKSAWWRRVRLFGVAAVVMVVLGGCSVSPEASRVPGEPGADVGNHGNPVVLLAPPDRFDRIYAQTPYDGPRIAKPDTAQS